MVYKKYNKNSNIKLILASALSLLFLLAITVYGFKVLFLSKNSSRYNSLLYVQVLNDAMPIIEVASFEKENMSEQSITIKGEVLRLLGINMYNPLSIMSREVSFFSDLTYEFSEKVEPKSEEVRSDYALDINPFSLSPSSISSDSVNSGDSGNSSEELPNKVVQVQDPNLKQTLNKDKPRILIYHSHTEEAFAPNGNYNADQKKNIVDVGESLKYELETNYGISVLHDKTVHCYPFNSSYRNSRKTVEKYIKEYGDFDLVIDMHRDAVYSKNNVTVKMNGENVSRIMFVLAKNNPHFNKNNEVATELTKIANDLFPGYCRSVYYYPYSSVYFNQDKSNNAILIEVGAHTNTHEESKNSAKYMGRVIAEYLKERK